MRERGGREGGEGVQAETERQSVRQGKERFCVGPRDISASVSQGRICSESVATLR